MIIMMLIIVLGLIGLFTYRLDRKGPEQKADRQTALALAQAKEALIGYAARDANRPGSLPCPDKNDDGLSKPPEDYPCDRIVARLPWSQLGLPDLRDGSGERLWYAISPAFASNKTSVLNSTTLGQITIRDAIGAIIYDAGAIPSTGVIAVVIAPGAVITRQGAIAPQDRTCTGGGGCDSEMICQVPYQSVAKCAPSNYLDALVGVEDNSDFLSPVGTPRNGFVLGPIMDATRREIVNDRIIVITRQDLFPTVKKRIFAELKGTQTTALLEFFKTHSYFPWAADTDGGLQTPGNTSGFVPLGDLKFPDRCDSSSCINQGTMILNQEWSKNTIYEVAPAFAPDSSPPRVCSPTTCFTVGGIPNARAKITIDGTVFGIW